MDGITKDCHNLYPWIVFPNSLAGVGPIKIDWCHFTIDLGSFGPIEKLVILLIIRISILEVFLFVKEMHLLLARHLERGVIIQVF